MIGYRGPSGPTPTMDTRSHTRAMSRRRILRACSADRSEVIVAAMDRGFRPTKDHVRKACAAGSANVVRALLSRGHDGLVDDEFLTDAARNDRPHVLSALLDSGVPPDMAPQSGITALMVACQLDHIRCAQVLLDAGASPSAVALVNGTTPLLEVSRNKGSVEMATMLLDRGAMIVPGDNGYSPLLLAVTTGNEALVECFLRRGLPQTPSPTPFLTPLYVACDCGNARMAHMLLDHGAVVDYPDLRLTPLFESVTRSMPDVALRILERATVFEHPHEDEPPPRSPPSVLAEACARGLEDVVRALLKRGAAVDPPHLRESPLFKAAEGGHVGIVELLLQAGARQNHDVHNAMTTPLNAAIVEGHTRVAELLLEHDPPRHLFAQAPSPLRAAVMSRDIDIVRLLLKIPWGETDKFRNNFSVLNYACLFGLTDIARLLIDAGVLPYCPDKTVCLAYAARGGMLEVCEALLDAGAELAFSQDILRFILGAFTSALECAAESGHAHVARCLLDRGAKIVDSDGRSHCLAVAQRGTDVRQVLLTTLLSRPAELCSLAESSWDEDIAMYDLAMLSMRALSGISTDVSKALPRDALNLVNASYTSCLRFIIVHLARAPLGADKRLLMVRAIETSIRRPAPDVLTAMVFFTELTRDEILDLYRTRRWDITESTRAALEWALVVRDAWCLAKHKGRGARMSWPVWQRIIQTIVGVPTWWFSDAWWDGSIDSAAAQRDTEQ